MHSNATIPRAPSSTSANTGALTGHSGSAPFLRLNGPDRQGRHRGKRASQRLQQQKRNARDAVSLVRDFWRWGIDVVKVGYAQLYDPVNLLPVAQAQAQGEVCDVGGHCDDRVPVHPSIDQLRRFAGGTFSLLESPALQQRSDRSLDGVVVLIGDPDHDAPAVQKQIDRVVHFLYRPGDFHFIECPPERLAKKRSLWRGIDPAGEGRRGGTIGMADAELYAAALPSSKELDAAWHAKLSWQLEFLGRDASPDGRPLAAMSERELQKLDATLDDEVKRRGLLKKLAGDTRYAKLVDRLLRLRWAHAETVRKFADRNSVKMAQVIASQVQAQAQGDRAEPSTCSYIESAGAGHLDVMIAELEKNGITDYVVLCHSRSVGRGHARVCGPPTGEPTLKPRA